MTLLFLLFAAAVPTATDVQKAEEARIIEPLIDYGAAADGRGFVEFSPTVETRNATCAPTQIGGYECTYDARVKGGIANAFGPWEAKRERLIWRKECGCWRTASLKR